MNWEQLFQQWEVARSAPESHRPPYRNAVSEDLEEKVRNTLQQHPVPEVDWLVSALEGITKDDERKRDFLGMALRPADQIPSVLFHPLLRAAVHDRYASARRSFIEPCLRSEGRRQVNEELLRYLEDGTNDEKRGAVNAFYWSLAFYDSSKEEDLNDLLVKIFYRFLTEFVTNEDVQVRRSILPMLPLKMYPESLQALVSQAIHVARIHEDEYIRQRVEIQLG